MITCRLPTAVFEGWRNKLFPLSFRKGLCYSTLRNDICVRNLSAAFLRIPWCSISQPAVGIHVSSHQGNRRYFKIPIEHIDNNTTRRTSLFFVIRVFMSIHDIKYGWRWINEICWFAVTSVNNSKNVFACICYTIM